MAFRRFSKRPRTFGSKGLAGIRRAIAKKAPRRFDRFIALGSTVCEPTDLAISQCPFGESDGVTSPNRIVLLSDDFKTQNFEDDVTVVAITGSVYLSFTPDLPSEIVQIAPFLGSLQFEYFGGIRKIRQNYGEIGATQDDPIAAPLSNLNDMGDVFWVRPKHKRYFGADTEFQSHVLALAGESAVGACSSVTAPGAGAATNTLTNGSGVVNIPAISTDCCAEVCREDVTGIQYITRNVRHPRGWTHSLNSRKRIRLKDKDALVFECELMVGETVLGAPPEGTFQLRGIIRLTLEV